MRKEKTEVLGLRVKRDLYDYYAESLTGLEKSYVYNTLKAVFEQLVSDIKNKKESGESLQFTHQGEQQLVVKVEHTLKTDDTTLRLYRKIESLEKELTKALANLEEMKEQLEKERSEREKCIQELGVARAQPQQLQKELQRKEAVARELLDLTNLVLYCFESQRCDMAKLSGLIKSKLNKLGVEPTKPNDILLSLVTPK